MTIINKDFSDRKSKIFDGLKDLGLDNLEAKITPKSNLAFGIVHVDLFENNQKVGEIMYDKEPPAVTFYDSSYKQTLKDLDGYFASN